MLLRLRCLLVGHIWCWDPYSWDVFVEGGPIHTCARCGGRRHGGDGLLLGHRAFAGLTRRDVGAP
jgi:hypothetical protein